MRIQEVNNRKDLERFISFPWSIYRNDPYWVPPLKWDVHEFLNPKKHPFYQHGKAAKFLLLDGSEVLGRILVADDVRFNEQNHSQVGTFGMFECINDQSAANLLFNTASQWSQSFGRTLLQGPIDYSTNYNCGLLIDGFETPPRMMMPHHPRYYKTLLENYGFQKNKDLFAWWFQDPHDIIEKWRPILDRLSQRHAITVRPFSRKHFKEDVRRCLKIYDNARSNWWWACVSLTDAEVEFFVKQLALFGDENLVYIAETKGENGQPGEPVGFSITMPDLNEAIKPLNGNLTWCGVPIGLARLFWNARKIKTARMMVLCVLPEYRQKGVGERLIFKTLDYAKNHAHYTGGELSWTDESNDKINRIIERLGAEKYKTYRVFEKKIEAISTD